MILIKFFKKKFNSYRQPNAIIYVINYNEKVENSKCGRISCVKNKFIAPITDKNIFVYFGFQLNIFERF